MPTTREASVARRTTSSTTRYLYDGANAAQELVGGSPTANVLAGGIDEVFQRTDGAGTRAVLTDALGSTVALVDGSGVVQTQYTYEPFGATSTSGAASTNPAQFTGRENDETGLYYYRARYYSPQLQRFVAEDPLGFDAGDVNLHTYVGNEPTRLIDPTGLVAFLPPPFCRPPGGRKDPPLSWWLRCSPIVVPDLIPAVPDLPNIQVDGPLGTRLIQLRYDGMPVIRLDYGPYPGTAGEPRVHLHLPGIWPDWHIPLDPRAWR